MKILVMSNLDDIIHDEIDRCLIEKRDCYDAIVLLGNIDIDTLKHIKYTLLQNNISKNIIGITGNCDIEGALEAVDIENIHLKSKSLNGKNFLGFNGLNKLDIYTTHIQKNSYELLENLEKCDILISYNSPQGYEENFMDNGLIGLTNYINKNKPYFCIHAHKYTNSINLIENTCIIGVHGIAIIDIDELAIIKLY